MSLTCGKSVRVGRPEKCLVGLHLEPHAGTWWELVELEPWTVHSRGDAATPTAPPSMIFAYHSNAHEIEMQCGMKDTAR